MRVFLDGQPVTPERPTIASALDAGVREAGARGRIIVEASIDGVQIPPEILESRPEGERPGSEVRFLSAEPRALVRLTLLDVADALGRARIDQKAAADLIAQGRIDEAMGHLSAALVAWDAVRQVYGNGPTLLGLGLDDLPTGSGADGKGAAARIEHLANRLGEVKRAVEVSDWVGLADALAYDLEEEALAWQGALVALAGAIRDGAGRSETRGAGEGRG